MSFHLLPKRVATSILISFAVLFATPSKTFESWSRAKDSQARLPFPDFSYVSYKNGEMAPPVNNLTVFDVTQYGAVPNDRWSDKKAIRLAIEAAKAAGGGVVFFPAGKYILQAPGDDEDSIRVDRSDIVLRGVGAGTGGTELQYLQFLDIPDPKPMWASKPILLFAPITGNDRDPVITALKCDTGFGDMTIEVEDASALKAGDWVFLNLESPEATSTYMEGLSVDPGWTEISKKGIMLKERHRIAKVEANRLTLAEPVNLILKKEWGVKLHRFTCIQNVGIENLTLRGNWKKSFVHHRSWEDDAAWGLLSFGRVVDGYARRLRLADSCNPLNISQCLHFSATMIRIEGNGGHSALGINGSSTACLAGWIDCEAPFWHGPGPSGGANANVYYQTEWTEKTSPELHASQPFATLYDRCSGTFIYSRDGGAVPNLPNHLGYLMFWNFTQTSSMPADYSFWLEKNWGKVVHPWIVGFQGDGSFQTSSLHLAESLGSHVDEESLWQSQLKKRLGRVPQWIFDYGKEWEVLKAKWRAEPLGALLVAEETVKEALPGVDGKVRHPSASQVWNGPWTFTGASSSGKSINDFPQPDGPFSVALRFQLADQPTVYQNLLMRELSGKRNLAIFTRGVLKWGVTYGDEIKAVTDDIKLNPADNKAHSLVMTLESAKQEVRFHLDGKLAQTIKMRGPTLPEINAPVTLGNGATGSIDYVAYWNKALSIDEANAASK